MEREGGRLWQLRGLAWLSDGVSEGLLQGVLWNHLSGHLSSWLPVLVQTLASAPNLST